MEIIDGQIPLRRPHFRLEDGKLYFLISRRPHAELSPAEVDLWNRFDGTTTVGLLRNQQPHAAAHIRRLWDLGAVELIEPVAAAARRRILIVEPHMDDAILSVGGIMWRRRRECEFSVLSVVGVSNFTSYYRLDRDYFDTDTVSTLRRAESDTAMRVLGGHHRTLDLHDAPLRYQPGAWTRAWYAKHRRSVSAYINRGPKSADIEALAELLRSAFASTTVSEIWIPLGVGTSTDHEMTRNACLRALWLSPTLAASTSLHLYQDVPYALQYPRHTAQIISAIVSGGGELEPIIENINDAIDAKLRLLDIFGSQFKPSYMAPKVVATARQASGSPGKLAEVLYRVRRMPTRIDFGEMYSGRDAVYSMAGRLGAWYSKHRDAPRIRVICPIGVGCWRDDMMSLLAAFPRAVFEIHLIADAVEETIQFESPRIDVRPVQATKLAWILHLLRVLMSRPVPLIAVTSNRFSDARRMVQFGCFWMSPVVVTTIDHFVQALSLVAPARSSGCANID